MAPDFSNLLVTRRDFLIRTYKIDNISELETDASGETKLRLRNDFPEFVSTTRGKNVNAWAVELQWSGS